jgi:hypothetical protein
LVSLAARGITFRWKDYRADGEARRKLMTLSADEFIRRFLIRVLPTGFHRTRHYGLFANGPRAANLAKVRVLLQPRPPAAQEDAVREPAPTSPRACPCCGDRMLLIETFERGAALHSAPVTPVIRIDTS